MEYKNTKILQEISLVTANFEESEVFRNILLDWFNFLGGKPGEVVVVDCGSSLKTHEMYWELFQEGLIDKLQLIQSSHEDNTEGKASCYIKEYTSGAISSKPYILFFKSDTLPYQNENSSWLKEALHYLERDDIFAIGGSFNKFAKHHDAWDGWYFSCKCSLNFALMKRSMFIASTHEYAGDYILSGFKGENPAEENNQARFLIEVAWEQYMQNHNLYTLCKIENPDWTVFHTNTHSGQLKKNRNKYLKRKDINRFINAGLDEKFSIPGQGKYYGNFCGQPKINPLKKFRILFGNSIFGIYWRKAKQKILLK